MDKKLLNRKYYIEKDILIEINNVEKEEEHTHDFIEFVYMLSGKSVHTVDGVEYPMNRGDLLIINYNQIHSFNGEKSARFCNILIKPAFLDRSLSQSEDLFLLFDIPQYIEFRDFINDKCNYICFSPEEKNCFEYMLLLLHKELEELPLGYKLTTQAGVDFLLTMIFRKMSISQKNFKNGFKLILEYINENYSQNISAVELARMCHYNPSYFSRIFKKYTGVTFSEYLKKVRIENACKLIERSNESINSIYPKVGYTNKTKFYKHFRELLNTTPLKYKSNYSVNSN